MLLSFAWCNYKFNAIVIIYIFHFSISLLFHDIILELNIFKALIFLLFFFIL